MNREKLYPLNRYLTVRLVDRNEEKQEQSTVLVPDGYYEETPSAYVVAEVLEANIDSKLKEGMWLLAPTSAVETAEIHGQTHYLLLENHVMGFLS